MASLSSLPTELGLGMEGDKMKIMQTTSWIVRHRWRGFRRHLARQVFGFFVLGPLLVGVALWIVERYLDQAWGTMASYLAGAPGARLQLLAYVSSLFFLAVLLPKTRQELFPQTSPHSCLDILPVTERSHFHNSFLVGTARNLLVPILFLLLIHRVVGPSVADSGSVLLWLLRLIAMAPALALTQILLTLSWVHFGPWHGRRRALAATLMSGLAAVVVAASVGPSSILATLRDVLFFPLWLATFQLAAVLSEAFAVATVPFGGLADVGWLLGLLFLYQAVWTLYRRWRRADLERAAQREVARRTSMRRALASFLGRLEPGVAALVWRDLLLIVRRFSPAVDVALAAVGLTFLALLSLPRFALGTGWSLRAAQLGGFVATLSLVALVPLLIKHQLPRLWIEKSTGVDLQQVWRAKLWLARLLALPPLLIGGAMLVFLAPSGFVVGLATFWGGGWMIATTIGLASFEIAERPILALIFSASIGLAFASLLIFVPAAWWLWVVAYLVVGSLVADRAARRVRFTEVES